MEPTTLWALPEDLAEVGRDDPDFIDSILDTFLEQAELSLASIRQCVSSLDTEGAARAVHKFKGSAAQIGAPGAAAKCKALQTSLQTEGVQRWGECLQALEAECEQLLAGIRSFRASR